MWLRENWYCSENLLSFFDDSQFVTFFNTMEKRERKKIKGRTKGDKLWSIPFHFHCLPCSIFKLGYNKCSIISIFYLPKNWTKHLFGLFLISASFFHKMIKNYFLLQKSSFWLFKAKFLNCNNFYHMHLMFK